MWRCRRGGNRGSLCALAILTWRQLYCDCVGGSGGSLLGTSMGAGVGVVRGGVIALLLSKLSSSLSSLLSSSSSSSSSLSLLPLVLLSSSVSNDAIAWRLWETAMPPLPLISERESCC